MLPKLDVETKGKKSSKGKDEYQYVSLNNSRKINRETNHGKMPLQRYTFDIVPGFSLWQRHISQESNKFNKDNECSNQEIWEDVLDLGTDFDKEKIVKNGEYRVQEKDEQNGSLSNMSSSSLLYKTTENMNPHNTQVMFFTTQEAAKYFLSHTDSHHIYNHKICHGACNKNRLKIIKKRQNEKLKTCENILYTLEEVLSDIEKFDYNNNQLIQDEESASDKSHSLSSNYIGIEEKISEIEMTTCMEDISDKESSSRITTICLPPFMDSYTCIDPKTSDIEFNTCLEDLSTLSTATLTLLSILPSLNSHNYDEVEDSESIGTETTEVDNCDNISWTMICMSTSTDSCNVVKLETKEDYTDIRSKKDEAIFSVATSTDKEIEVGTETNKGIDVDIETNKGIKMDFELNNKIEADIETTNEIKVDMELNKGVEADIQVTKEAKCTVTSTNSCNNVQFQSKELPANTESNNWKQSCNIRSLSNENSICVEPQNVSIEVDMVEEREKNMSAIETNSQNLKESFFELAEQINDINDNPVRRIFNARHQCVMKEVDNIKRTVYFLNFTIKYIEIIISGIEETVQKPSITNHHDSFMIGIEQKIFNDFHCYVQSNRKEVEATMEIIERFEKLFAEFTVENRLNDVVKQMVLEEFLEENENNKKKFLDDCKQGVIFEQMKRLEEIQKHLNIFRIFVERIAFN